MLDLSKTALSLAQARLDKRAQTVTWLDGDIASIGLPIHGYELWHDRAAFHFLIAAERQRQYCDQLLKALRPGGHLIIATFAPECSGLPVQRYTSEELKNTLGQEFELRHDVKKMHFTPSGIKQMYLYCHFRRAASHCTN